jgi:hypothetical protein
MGGQVEILRIRKINTWETLRFQYTHVSLNVRISIEFDLRRIQACKANVFLRLSTHSSYLIT